jgi:SPP1 gp7 family putative phage head morphogenesis protein
VGEYIELFNSFKTNILRNDEINILSKVNALYKLLNEITNTKLLELAQLQYEYITQGDYSTINNEWLLNFLEYYNPVTKYVYANEVDRKRSRMYEAIMSSETPTDEIEQSLKYWCSTVVQAAIDITDMATKTAYKDCNIEKVEWVSEDDKKRCKNCEKLDGKIFLITEVPPKQHRHCRCFCIPV